jgi:phospholipid transport system substrate-binding protein
MSVTVIFEQKLLFKSLSFFIIFFGLMHSSLALANNTPHAVVEKTVNDLVSALTTNSAKLKNNPAGYEKIVNDILVPIVDFETISKHVMGKTHYLAANEDQRKKFQVAFKQSLVSTYSTGLAIFDSQEIKVQAPEAGTETQEIQTVNMDVKTSDGTIFPLRFTMRKDASGSWKVVNVIINGVNVAKAYNSHFSESITKYAGDIDQLINNWNAKITTEKAPVKQ